RPLAADRSDLVLLVVAAHLGRAAVGGDAAPVAQGVQAPTLAAGGVRDGIPRRVQGATGKLRKLIQPIVGRGDQIALAVVRVHHAVGVVQLVGRVVAVGLVGAIQAVAVAVVPVQEAVRIGAGAGVNPVLIGNTPKAVQADVLVACIASAT